MAVRWEQDNWRDRAACRNLDPDLFFPEVNVVNPTLEEACLSCPVREDCYTEARVTRAYGYWAANFWNHGRVVKATSTPRVTGTAKKQNDRDAVCGNCGHSFKTTFAHRAYCSDECLDAANTKRMPPKVTHTCRGCGEPYDHEPVAGLPFCSVECLRRDSASDQVAGVVAKP